MLTMNADWLCTKLQGIGIFKPTHLPQDHPRDLHKTVAKILGNPHPNTQLSDSMAYYDFDSCQNAPKTRFERQAPPPIAHNPWNPLVRPRVCSVTGHKQLSGSYVNIWKSCRHLAQQTTVSYIY